MKMMTVTACLVIVALVSYAATVKAWKQRYGKSDTKSFVQTDTPDETVFAKSLQTRIVGGTIAKHGDIPWQAAVVIYDTDEKPWNCGASIIDEFWLVSAAHCFTKKIKWVKVIVGALNFHSHQDIGEQRFTVNSRYIHEEYNPITHDNDIALLRIKPSNKGSGIEFNEFVQPIRLPDAGTNLKVGTKLLVSGWGWTLPCGSKCEKQYESLELKKAEIPVIDQSTCQKLDRRVTSRMFCAGSSEGVPDTCKGDSGGPAAYETEGQYVLYGIVSWGDGCAQPGKTSAYTRVTSFLPWIESKMQL